MTPQQLDAIRRRDAGPQRDEHDDATADRRALLEYIDEVNRQVHEIGGRQQELLGAQRILLGIRILEDGHAPNLGAAIRIAEDLDQVAKLYPEPPA